MRCVTLLISSDTAGYQEASEGRHIQPAQAVPAISLPIVLFLLNDECLPNWHLHFSLFVPVRSKSATSELNHGVLPGLRWPGMGRLAPLEHLHEGTPALKAPGSQPTSKIRIG